MLLMGIKKTLPSEIRVMVASPTLVKTPVICVESTTMVTV